MKEPFIFLCSEITRDNALNLMKWLENLEVKRYLSDSHDVSKNIEQVLNRANLPILTHLFNQKGRFYMAYTKQNIPIGFVRLVKKSNDFEIVIVIGDQNNWGKKLGTATIRESIKIAFFDFRAQKVIAKIHKENKRSIRAFINAGFIIDYETPLLKIFAITMERYLASVKGGTAMSASIYITEIDKERLIKIINEELFSGKAMEKSIRHLENEIHKAVIVNSKQISKDIITMNSQALLHIDDEDIEVSLVYPKDADLDTNKMSVFSPIGTAILGYGEGDVIEWEVPSGTAKIHIKKILYQPEAAGDYHM
ncbi:regulator of nucleoside diphosphate kinase [Oxobacter pfennigii]|uniref:Regulator of nucleoside diphosphate kinase n=1 Tax=Oxobacter pfennigii TaxID=36849 RepID=A0A0P8WAA2_9CLOT|nr:GNAT family N-acetyltransferase [Oxobacter pfennigii]KPU44644.1 regulator of nucleoside diphosphate kinase [Oxobacter pfennigii]